MSPCSALPCCVATFGPGAGLGAVLIQPGRVGSGHTSRFARKFQVMSEAGVDRWDSMRTFRHSAPESETMFNRWRTRVVLDLGNEGRLEPVPRPTPRIMRRV